MKKLLIFLCFVLCLSGCTAKEQKYDAYYTDVFDTFSSFTCYAKSKEEFDDISERLHTMLLELNKKLDIYNSYDGINNIKTINDNAGIKPVKVDDDIIDILIFGKEAFKNTNGTVNIAMGSVLSIWHDYREKALDDPDSASIPSIDELKNASKYIDINSIVIDEKNSTVFITDKNTKIDVGAIAKGFCCNKARTFLEENNVKAALLNLGGNIICINDNDIKPSWTIGVQDPDSEEEYIEKYDLSNQSAVTSGNYQRYYEYKGKKYHHIIDHKTLMPSDNNKSVTIIDSDSAEADMLSTALFIMPYESGVKLANKYNVTALWVTSAGEIKTNKEMVK